MDGEEGSDQALEASPLREHDQLKDAFADMYQTLNSWSNLHLSIYKEFLAIRRAISLNETFVLFC